MSLREWKELTSPTLLPLASSPACAYRMVCRQVQDTVHHIFNSWFWSAPVMRNLQKGTLQSNDTK